MTSKLYLEDFADGQRFEAGPFHMEADAIMRFAAEFDPQPFHLEPAAGVGARIVNCISVGGRHSQ